MSTANTLTAELLIQIPKRFPNVRIWRNNRIKAMAVGRNGKPRMISAGIDGQGDLSGLAAPRGTRIEIEVKAGRDRQSDAQRNFQAMIERLGGVYIVARDVEQAVADLWGRLA